MTGLATAPTTDPVGRAIDAVAALAARLEREDLVARLEEIGRRVARTDTVVCVVGEFKQGKSALINGLLGAPICPVDDDLATSAVTVVRHGEETGVTVRRREAGDVVTESIATDAIAAWALERDGGPSDRRSDVELVEVALPHPFLEPGVTLVDTPGVGGLNAGHAAATLAFLPTADALVFVTDASAELSAAELAFLASARRAGPPVFVAVTKIDMYPEWRRIVDLDAGHLATVGYAEPIFPLSAVLRLGPSPQDVALAGESGYEPFVGAITGDAVRTARAAAREAALLGLDPVLDQLRGPLAAELAGLERPDAADEVANGLADVRRRLAALADADASWAVRLEDEFAALRHRVTFAFATRMRQLTREAQDDVETVDPAEAWPDLSRRVQEGAASAVGEAFLAATDGAAAVQATIASILADEDLGIDPAGAPISFDVRDLWEGRPEFEGRTRRGVMASFGVFTGAKAGIDMLGMLGTLLGAAIVGPAVLGVALAFGGKEVLSERRRQLTDRRQQARTFLGDFIEEVRFGADGRLAVLLDDIQRQMRARFADRIRELQRTYAASAEALERASEQAGEARRRRREEAEATLTEIDTVAARVAEVRAT